MDKRIFKILLLCTVLYLLFGQLFLPRETKSSEHEYTILNDGWEWLHKDGTTEPITIPGNYDVPRNEEMTIVRKLPGGIRDNSYLLFYSVRQDVKIYISGLLRDQYSTEDTRLFGKTSSAYYMYTELTEQDAGREIRIKIRTDSDYSGVVREICYGDMISLNGRLLQSGGLDVILSVLMLILGVTVLLICLVLRRSYEGRIPLEYLSWCICLLAGWSLMNSVFRQYFFPNLSTASDVTFILVMLLPFPFLIYMNELQKGRYRLLYMIMEVLVLIDAVASVALNVEGFWDFSDTITVNILSCGISILLILGTAIVDVFVGNIKEYLLSAIGLLGACLAGAVQCVLYLNRNSSSVSSIMVSLGMLFLLILSGISTVRELTVLNREKQRAIQSSQTQAQFLATMSHEIRTPINAVLGMDEMILRESEQKEVLEYATDIQNAGKSLLAIINDILDFSKVESGKMELVPVEYSLAGLIRDCYNMIAVRARDKDLPVVIKNNPDLPATLYGDEVRIRQIVINFLTNAVKYTENGSVTLVLDGQQEENGVSRDDWRLKISVRDTGMGVKEEDVPHLFDAFARMDAEKNRNVEGSGLGLALSNSLAKIMGGTIEVESVYGEGSTFTLLVPQQARGRESIGEFRMDDAVSRIAAPRKSVLYAPGTRILVVDDVAVNLKVFTSLLKKSGMTIDTAESGEECLSRVREWTYDMIFLDHMMPVMDGMEVMRRIRQMEFGPNASTPVIMLTANAILGAREEYLQAGFADYLSKPIQIEELEAMIAKYLKK